MSMYRHEVRQLVKSKLRDGMTADEAADAVAGIFYTITDRWDTIDIHTVSERPGSNILRQRYLVLEIPRESGQLQVAPDP